MTLDLSRRRFFGILAAPAIVRAASLMPVSVWDLPDPLFEVPSGIFTPSMLSRETLVILENNLVAAMKINRQFQTQFLRTGLLSRV